MTILIVKYYYCEMLNLNKHSPEKPTLSSPLCKDLVCTCVWNDEIMLTFDI